MEKGQLSQKGAAALIRITVRRVWVSLAGGYPYAALFRQVLAQLQALPLRVGHWPRPRRG